MERLPRSAITRKYGPCKDQDVQDLPKDSEAEKSGQPLGLPGPTDLRTCTKAFKLKTFKVTLSFADDADDADDAWLVKYLKRYTSHAYAVAEHGENGKRHLHAAMCFTDMRLRDHVRDSFVLYIKKRNSTAHADSLPKVAVVVNAMHDHLWYEEYLKKENDVQVLYDTYDADEVGKHFPSADIQRELQAIRDINRAGDPRFANLHVKFLEWYQGDLRAVSFEHTFEFLNRLMYVDKTHRVIQDPRKVHQACLALYRYVTGDIRMLDIDKRFMTDVFG